MTTIAQKKLFEEFYEKFNKTVSVIEYKAENFMDFLVKAMEKMEEFAKEKSNEIKIYGIEKKEMVMDLVMKYYENFKIWGEEKKQDWEKFQTGMKYYMDKVIDILIAAFKGQLHLNKKIKNTCNKCWSNKVNKKTKEREFRPKDINEIISLTDNIHDQVKLSIVNKKFGPNNFIVLVTIVIQVLDKLENVTGEEKREIAVRVIKRLILEIPMSDEDRETVKIIIDNSLEKTIDYIIMAAKGELDFGKIVEKFKKIFSCCFPKQN